MSDEESSVASIEFENDDEHGELPEFNPTVSGVGYAAKPLRDFEELENVAGEDLHRVLPQAIDSLYFEGNVNSVFTDYQKVLDLLQSNRRWRFIRLSDNGMESASEDFLSLVALAATKVNEVFLMNCPFDVNFFAFLHPGIKQNIRLLSLSRGNIPISTEAATVLAMSLAASTSLERLEVSTGGALFEDDNAGLQLAEGIQRNSSLKELIVDESSIGTPATKSILWAVLQGELRKLSMLSITLNAQSDCSSLVTKLISSDKSYLETLIIGNLTTSRSDMLWDDDDTMEIESVNRRLKSFRMWGCSLDESFLTSALARMPMLESISLSRCGVSDLAPIIHHLRLPTCAVKSLNLKGNDIEVDEMEKFVSYLEEMRSLTILIMGSNPWCDDEDEEEGIKRIVQKVSRCRNLERFLHGSFIADEVAGEYNLKLNLRINRAWRRDLSCNMAVVKLPSNLFPLIAARALRRIESDMQSDPSLGPNVIFPLVQERCCDLIAE